MTERKWVDENGLEESNRYPISASALKAYNSCPEKYRYRYKTDLNGTKKSKGYLELGSAVHLALENVLSEGVPLYEDRLSRDFIREYNNINGDIPEDMVGDGEDYLEVAARLLEAESPDIKGVEESFEFGLESLNRRFRGIIDITTDEKVLDWKTGRIDSERTPMEEKIQGSVYMKGYEQLYGHYPEKVEFIYLKEESKRALETGDKIWDEMIEVAQNLVQAEENDEYIADPDDSKCFFCGYAGFCSASPTGVGSIDYINF